jgi:4-amino-4-deoxy-L-arabinose transferase-like glycosyltransferase
MLEWKFSLRAPGYIFFLAASFLPSGGADRIFVRLVQSLLSTVTIALIYGIAGLTFYSISRARSRNVALLAATLLAVFPDIVFFSQTLWSETFFVFITALAIYLILWSYRSGRFPAAYALSGLMMGLAILTREALLLFGAGFVPLWLWLVSSGARRERLLRAVVYLAALLLVLLPWGARNYAQGRGLQLISSQGERDLIIYNLVALAPETSDRAIRVMRRENGRTTEFDEELRRRIVAGIIEDPFSWASAKSEEVRELWEDSQSNVSQFGRQLKLVSPTEAARAEPALQALWLIVLAFAVVGFLYPQDGMTKLLFLGYFFSWVAIFFLVHFIPRFRLGLIPFLLPFSAYGFVRLSTSLYALLNTQPLVLSSPTKDVLETQSDSSKPSP